MKRIAALTILLADPMTAPADIIVVEFEGIVTDSAVTGDTLGLYPAEVPIGATVRGSFQMDTAIAPQGDPPPAPNAGFTYESFLDSHWMSVPTLEVSGIGPLPSIPACRPDFDCFTNDDWAYLGYTRPPVGDQTISIVRYQDYALQSQDPDVWRRFGSKLILSAAIDDTAPYTIDGEIDSAHAAYPPGAGLPIDTFRFYRIDNVPYASTYSLEFSFELTALTAKNLSQRSAAVQVPAAPALPLFPLLALVGVRALRTTGLRPAPESRPPPCAFAG